MEADFPGNNMFFVTFVIAQAIGHHHNSALATFAGVQKCAGDILILKSYTVDDKLYASVERGDWPIIRMVTRDYLRILLWENSRIAQSFCTSLLLLLVATIRLFVYQTRMCNPYLIVFLYNTLSYLLTDASTLLAASCKMVRCSSTLAIKSYLPHRKTHFAHWHSAYIALQRRSSRTSMYGECPLDSTSDSTLDGCSPLRLVRRVRAKADQMGGRGALENHVSNQIDTKNLLKYQHATVTTKSGPISLISVNERLFLAIHLYFGLLL